MELKYQKEIDALGFEILCPNGLTPTSERTHAFRLCFDPIDNKLNFLPNIVFDAVKKIPFNYKTASEDVKCRRCAASFYTTQDNLRKKWNSMPEMVRQNLGYTHIAEGFIDNTDGLIRPPDKNGHFGLYESKEAELHNKFSIISES